MMIKKLLVLGVVSLIVAAVGLFACQARSTSLDAYRRLSPWVGEECRQVSILIPKNQVTGYQRLNNTITFHLRSAKPLDNGEKVVQVFWGTGDRRTPKQAPLVGDVITISSTKPWSHSNVPITSAGAGWNPVRVPVGWWGYANVPPEPLDSYSVGTDTSGAEVTVQDGAELQRFQIGELRPFRS